MQSQAKIVNCNLSSFHDKDGQQPTTTSDPLRNTTMYPPQQGFICHHLLKISPSCSCSNCRQILQPIAKASFQPNPDHLCAIPTPPLAIVNKLIKAPELSESQLIHTPELTTHRLPLWIISYWIQVFHLRPLKKKWLDAEEALHKQEHGKGHTIETKGLINCVYNALACISWAGNINRFSASISTDHLATYLTKDWFSDEHENQMLYLLKQEVLREKRDNGIDVCDSFFMKRLIDLLQDVGRSNRYATAANYAWLRE